MDEDVRLSIAGNIETPESALWILLEDPRSRVRGCLASNDVCPDELLELLTNDRDEAVARRAIATLRRRSERPQAELGSAYHFPNLDDGTTTHISQ